MTKTSRSKQVGLKHGFKSGLEDLVADQLEGAKVPFTYEQHTIRYLVPVKKSRYTPDFVLEHNGIIVETKGRFVTADRQKMKLIKEQHPDLDIRFVFSNPRSRISKQSLTTYGDWCEKFGFQYATKLIPVEWFKEPPNQKSLEALKEFRK